MRLFIVGLGVVGKGVLELLDLRRAELASHFGVETRLVGIADSRSVAINENGFEHSDVLHAKKPGGPGVASLPGGRALASQDELPAIIAHSGADVLIELGPTQMRAPKQATDRLLSAMGTGLHVVCANKAPLSTAFAALAEAAAVNNVLLRYSATVGAGTPMLTLARAAVMGDTLVGFRAILNGTTNFILSQMRSSGATFDSALAEAQRLGWAEADPSNDVDGWDTAMKTAIIACDAPALPPGRTISVHDVRTVGIRGVSARDHADAEAQGQVIKLVASFDAATTSASVEPVRVPIGSRLDVPAGGNVLLIDLKHAGELALFGRGAGSLETAAAVVRDLVEIAVLAR
jgi:homoserine dehydrogenase